MATKFAWQKVTPFIGLGAMSITRLKALALMMIRPIPRSGDTGGSSGWSAILILYLSATGMTSFWKYSMFAQIVSSLTSPQRVGPCFSESSRLNSMVSAPPRSTKLVRVRK
jgi:hypothetical protein